MLANVHVHHDHQTGRKHANLKGAWGKRRHLSTLFCFQRKRRLNMIGEPVRNSFGSCWVGNSLCFWTTYATYPPILDFGSLTKCTQSRLIPECFHSLSITHLPELEAEQPLGRVEMEQQSCPIDRSPHPLLPLVLTAAAPNLFLS